MPSVSDSIRSLEADGRQRRAERRAQRRYEQQLHAKEPIPRGHERRIKQPAFTKKNTHAPVMPGISPKRLARVLREVDNGHYESYLTAAAELEERDSQYGPQLATRRTAITALELSVHKPTGAKARATRAAQDLVDSKALADVIGCALDALGKGFAITEIVWKERDGRWWPTWVEHDQREFQWSEYEEAWRLRDGSYDGVELVPSKWVIHEPKLRAGHPIRRGLARPAMYLHMAKSMSIAGWVTLMAIFGLPLAIATVPTGDVSDNDLAVIRAALAGLGQGANAIVPSGAKVDIVKAADAGASPERMFSSLLNYVDQQMSKLVLGQTMTADSGSSKSQAEVHNDVRRDIREGDAEQLAQTLNRDVVRPFIEFNVGEQRIYPEVYFAQEDTRDVQAVADGLSKLLKHGLRVKADEARSLFGFSKPGENDETIGGGAAESSGDEPHREQP